VILIFEYLKEGFLHVLPLGWDHILFITSLFFLNSKPKAVIIQCTFFTIAHSITLALGASHFILPMSNVIEPIIALSIVFTAIENIFHSDISKWRLLLVFTFGLIHGLGFAAAFADLNLPQHEFIAALLGFNIGVELAQISIILILYYCIAKWLMHKPWYRNWLVYPVSCIIACIGLYWAIDRIILFIV
jgi:HupE / UreJ protein